MSNIFDTIDEALTLEREADEGVPLVAQHGCYGRGGYYARHGYGYG